MKSSRLEMTSPRLNVIVLLTLCALCTLAAPTLAVEYYIKADGTGDLPTIQAAIDIADVGDIITVAAGTYNWINQQGGSPPFALIYVGRFRDGFTLQSESGPEVTILDAQKVGRAMLIEGDNDLLIDGFTLRNGVAPDFGDNWGGGLALGHSTDVIRNCIFENNEAVLGAGMFAGGFATLRIENCIFRNNKASERGGGLGIFASTQPQFIIDCEFYGNEANSGAGIYMERLSMTIDNCVFVDNTAQLSGGGIFSLNMWPGSVIRRSTIAANSATTGSGIAFSTGSTVPLERSIVAFNEDTAALSVAGGMTITVSCTDIYGNFGSDALPAGATDGGDNFSMDPEFCNVRQSPDPTLAGNSPCAPGNHPDGASCGLIGARQVMCATSPVEDKTWGAIKEMWR